MSAVDLPAPSCKLGYTEADLASFIDDLPSFNRWMHGQTMSMCTGWVYDPSITMNVPDTGPCHNVGGHGMVVYVWDVSRYFTGEGLWD